MKILLVHDFYQNRGGEDFYVLSLNELLKKKGHQIYFYSKDNKNIQGDKLQASISLFYNPQTKIELESIINKFKPDIAHVHNVNPLISQSVFNILHQYRIPVIQAIHNYRFFCAKGSLFRVGKTCELCVKKLFPYPSIFYSCYHGSKLGSLIAASSYTYHQLLKSDSSINQFIFPSKFTQNYFIKNTKTEKEKGAVVPYFVNLIKSKEKQKRKNYFIYVGRLSEEKGILQLLKLFSGMPLQKLIVIGTGPLQSEVDKYKKYKNIKIKGFRPHGKIYEYMKNAIAIIIPSLWYETGPIVLIESFANYTPVITPKFGTFIEQVEDKKTGLFYQQNNWADLKQKILHANSHRNDLGKMGRNTRKVYQEKYTPEKHYEALMKIYQSAIRNNQIAFENRRSGM